MRWIRIHRHAFLISVRYVLKYSFVLDIKTSYIMICIWLQKHKHLNIHIRRMRINILFCPQSNPDSWRSVSTRQSYCTDFKCKHFIRTNILQLNRTVLLTIHSTHPTTHTHVVCAKNVNQLKKSHTHTYTHVVCAKNVHQFKKFYDNLRIADGTTWA